MNIGVLVYVKKDNNYLMIKRDKGEDDFHRGYYVAPGGKREKNESIMEAAKRELNEETGLISEKLKFMGFLNFPNLGNSPFETEWVGFVFICDSFKGICKKNCPEGDLFWVKESEMLELPMWEGDYIFTKLLLDEIQFDIKLWYENEKLIKKQINYL